MKEIKEMKEEIQQFLSLPKSGVLLDVRSEDTVDLNVFKGMVGTVVIFMCNHCPYVLHILDKLVDISREYIAKGISFIAISSNDIKNYPDDSPEKMKALAEEKDFPFPYLFDETQEVARAYHATCTPDFFLFDKNRNWLGQCSVFYAVFAYQPATMQR